LINPYLALATVGDGKKHYRKALDKGVLKILSKMGISTVQSYCGAQLFEAVGIGTHVINRYFTGTASRLGGIGLDIIAREAGIRHRAAFETTPRLEDRGEYHFRAVGEQHAWNPRTIAALQHAAQRNDPRRFLDFELAANDEAARTTLRGLLTFTDATPVPIDEVEPAAAIVRRFSTGAMSFGSLSKEAHETLAIAMNRLGGRSNTGEGGEDRARFGTEKRCRGPSPVRAANCPDTRSTRRSPRPGTPRLG
jgi:glutamate synthase (NADPH) large chain